MIISPSISPLRFTPSPLGWGNYVTPPTQVPEHTWVGELRNIPTLVLGWGKLRNSPTPLDWALGRSGEILRNCVLQQLVNGKYSNRTVTWSLLSSHTNCTIVIFNARLFMFQSIKEHEQTASRCSLQVVRPLALFQIHPNGALSTSFPLSHLKQ